MTATIPAPLALCVPADLIGVTYLFVSTEAMQYYLNGVFLSPLAEGCGITATATDGHKLACLHSADGYAAHEIILRVTDTKFLNLCRKLGRKKNETDHAWVCAMPGTIAVDGNQPAGAIELFLVRSGSERPDAAFITAMARHAPDPKATAGILARTHAEPIDGTFPEWRRVIPPTAEREKLDQPGYLNPAYVETFAEAAHALGTRMRITVPTDWMGPHFVDLVTPDFVGVIMPMREGHDGERYQSPGWLDIPSAANAALAAEREESRDRLAEQDMEKAA